MLEKSMEYSHELSIRLLHNEPNSQRTLAKNEYFTTNITAQQHDEVVEIELKTNHVGGGNFLLYFQGDYFSLAQSRPFIAECFSLVDSRLSEYAPLVLESDRKTDDANRRDKAAIKRDWGK